MAHKAGQCSCHGGETKNFAPITIRTRRPKAKLPKSIKVAKADEAIFRRVIEAAKKACENAYQPYSQYSVGAAALTFDGQIYTGFNIENCGYSQTIHAEEAAITGALNDGLLKRAAAQGVDQFHAILAVAVYAPKGSDPWPCCNCRQFMGEFGYGMHVIGEEPKDGSILCLTLDQLVPYAFPIEEVLRSVRGQR
ncbi:MAG: cytidine deaminase [Cyanobacteria bacterium PR.3.49]|nr:cytidine deaminase [Cyanobacteria bacterium PR.3.49]